MHHPQCRARRLPGNAPTSAALRANAVYHRIAALADDAIVAIELLDLRDDCPGWRVKTRMKNYSSCPRD